MECQEGCRVGRANRMEAPNHGSQPFSQGNDGEIQWDGDVGRGINEVLNIRSWPGISHIGEKLPKPKLYSMTPREMEELWNFVDKYGANPASEV